MIRKRNEKCVKKNNRDKFEGAKRNKLRERERREIERKKETTSKINKK